MTPISSQASPTRSDCSFNADFAMLMALMWCGIICAADGLFSLHEISCAQQSLSESHLLDERHVTSLVGREL